MQAHLTAMLQVVERLRGAGVELSVGDQVAALLNSLPESYSRLVIALKGRDEADLTVDYVCGRIQDECTRRIENRKMLTVGLSNETIALYSSNSGSPQTTQNKSKAFHHAQRGANKKENRQCYECGKKGHRRRNCPGAEVESKPWTDVKRGRSSTLFSASEITCSKQRSNWKAKVPDGRTVRVAGIGNGLLNSLLPGGRIQQVKICNVLYIQCLDGNLLSVKVLDRADYEARIRNGVCSISKQLSGGGNKLFASAHDNGQLYEIDVAECEICINGKMAEPPFAKSGTRPTKPVEQVHTDLCGSAPVTTTSGHRYSLTLIDNYSRYTEIRLLKPKDEVFDVIKNYVARMNTRFGRKPIIFRSDNDLSLSKRFWGDAVLTAAYLQNRLPSRSAECMPCEHFYGSKPAISHLRMLSSKAYSLVPKELRRKLSQSALEGVLVVYGNVTKGYRLLDPNTALVWYSHSVRIVENAQRKTFYTRKLKPALANKPSPYKMKQKPIEAVMNVLSRENVDRPIHKQEAPRRSERLAAKDAGITNPWLSKDYIWRIVEDEAKEPSTWEEMLQLSANERQRWMEAANAEILSLNRYHVWEVTDLPPGKTTISAKWVFKAKRNVQDHICSYKARLVARGFSQMQGRDYDETFASVVRHETVRIVFAVAAITELHVRHVDVNTAYLNGELDEELFLEPPPGFEQPGVDRKVLRLRRSLYGLKQSARVWNQVATDALRKLGFQPNRADPCLFSRKEKDNSITYILLYVDDLLIAGSSSKLTRDVGQQLNTYFEIKDFGEVSQYMGMEVEREEDGSFLICQIGKIYHLLQEHRLLDAKPDCWITSVFSNSIPPL
ncbi:hypothetical protein M514_23025 [Trichuris suis]|uniref:Zinc knuckle n=1 Tax=Trichuris suis TaxID=68888 RepID=A0A085N5R7_9BILA|nr:hypothetical protein M514_23025 [Trichuris suis]